MLMLTEVGLWATRIYFDRAKTGGLGQVIIKKQEKPHGVLDPAVFAPPLAVQNTLRSLKI